MKIIFDCTSAQPTANMQYNGGGEYALRVLAELHTRLAPDRDTLTLLSSKKKGDCPAMAEYATQGARTFSYSGLKDLSRFLSDNVADLIYFPVFYPAYSSLSIPDGLRVVGGIHDMSSFYYTYLGNQPYRYVKWGCLAWAAAMTDAARRPYRLQKYLDEHKKLFALNDQTTVYTVSYYTKIALEYFIPGAKVGDVFYSPMKLAQLPSREQEQKILDELALKPKKYILLCSASRWHKNNYRAAKAIDDLITEGRIEPDCQVVLLGCTERVKANLCPALKSVVNFHMLGFVPAETMETLYKNARLFVYLSLLEGFGYPPIEAMKYGTLSVCSTSTSIPEICGDAAIYCDPANQDSIKMALLQGFDPVYSHSFSQKLQARYGAITQKQEFDLQALLTFLLEP